MPAVQRRLHGVDTILGNILCEIVSFEENGNDNKR